MTGLDDGMGTFCGGNGATRGVSRSTSIPAFSSLDEPAAVAAAPLDDDRPPVALVRWRNKNVNGFVSFVSPVPSDS